MNIKPQSNKTVTNFKNPYSKYPEVFRPIPGHRQYEINEDGSIIRRIKYCSDRKSRNLRDPNHIVRQRLQFVKNPKHKHDGYMYVTLLSRDMLDINGVVQDCPYNYPTTVHRLVALAWCKPPSELKLAPIGDRRRLFPEFWVNHEDGNKLNNHRRNLKWGTISYNIQHSVDTGLRTIKTGKDHHRFGTKPTDETKKLMSDAKIGEKHPKFKGWYITPYGMFESSYEAARATGIGAKTIYNRCKANWKDYRFEKV